MKIKKLLSIALLAMALVTLVFRHPVLAADPEAGAKIFNAICASCHMGGKNVVVPEKDLRKETLEKYEMYSAEAIINQVTNGKGAMPAYGTAYGTRGRRLEPSQIEDVAAYVLQQAEKGWK